MIDSTTNELRRFINAVKSPVLKNHKDAGYQDVMDSANASISELEEVEAFYDSKDEREKFYREFYGEPSDLQGMENVSYIPGSQEVPQALGYTIGDGFSGIIKQ